MSIDDCDNKEESLFESDPNMNVYDSPTLFTQINTPAKACGHPLVLYKELSTSIPHYLEEGSSIEDYPNSFGQLDEMLPCSNLYSFEYSCPESLNEVTQTLNRQVSFDTEKADNPEEEPTPQKDIDLLREENLASPDSDQEEKHGIYESKTKGRKCISRKYKAALPSIPTKASKPVAQEKKASRGRPKMIPSPNEKQYMQPEHQFDAQEVIDKYLYGDEENFKENIRGRPRIYYSTKFADLLSCITEKCLKKIIANLQHESVDRVDAQLTSFFRKVRKIPLLLLQYYGSKTQYKDKGLRTPFISYIECFRVCFTKLFGANKNYSILELFLGFITTSLPISRVKVILVNLRNSNVISEELYSLYINLSEQSRCTSKKTIQFIFKHNLAFKLMVQKLPSFCKKGGMEINMKVYEKLESKIAQSEKKDF